MSDTLSPLMSADLAPIFWPPSRTGVVSAWYGHVPFSHWLVANVRPKVLVELGTHNGVSYCSFCEAVARMRLPTACYAVDTWQGDEHAGFYGEEVYNDLARFNSARYASFSELLRSTFDEALPYFADNSIDLLHIDGLHTYESVKHDFESWLPKLSNRAVLLLHDTNGRERNFGAWRLFLELKQRYPAFEFLHSYGLGVVAVGANAPDAVSALCSLDESSINAVRERFAMIGECWARESTPTSDPGRIDEHTQSIKALEEEIGSLRAELANLSGLDGALTNERVRADNLEAQLSSIKAQVGSLNSELVQLSSSLDSRLAGLLSKPGNWTRYDNAYHEWKKYRKKHVERREALEKIAEMYNVRAFFLLYPLYKIINPVRKLIKSLSGKDRHPQG